MIRKKVMDGRVETLEKRKREIRETRLVVSLVGNKLLGGSTVFSVAFFFFWR